MAPYRNADGSVCRSKCYVIKDANKPRDQWIVCPETHLRRKDTIGTILDPINEWVKENFRFSSPSLWTGEYTADDSAIPEGADQMAVTDEFSASEPESQPEEE